MQNNVSFFKSLYFKLSLTFLLVLAIVGFVELAFSVKGWRDLSQEVTQKLNWDLASQLAQEIQPLVGSEIDRSSLDITFTKLSQIMPRVDFYLLDSSGKIQYSYLSYGELVLSGIRLAPIKAALESATPELPIFADNPSRPKELSSFSVSPIVLRNSQGYLYLTFSSGISDFLERTTGQFYIARRVLRGVLVVSLSAFVLGSLFFYFLTRHFRELTSVVRAIEGGDLSARSKVNTKDEIGLLARSVNNMASTIVEKTQALAKSDASRRELVASLAHDLRGPLTTIGGYAETMLEYGDKLGEEEKAGFLSSIQNTVSIQSKLIDDLFELSVLEANEKQPQYVETQLIDLVKEVLDEYELRAAKKKIEIETSFATMLPAVLVDQLMIRRVVQNLVSNALSNTPENGSIGAEIGITGANRVFVKIWDTGPGILPADRQKVFERFYQTSKSKNRGEGTGLGLSIVKQILDSHNSDIKIVDEHNRGAVFVFELDSAF